MSHALNEGKAVFAVGDFNRDINDFCVKENGNVLLRAWHGKLLGDEGLLVKSTWFDENENLIEPGSYYFREEWSRIDNIFYSGKIEVEDFFLRQKDFGATKIQFHTNIHFGTEEDTATIFRLYAKYGF